MLDSRTVPTKGNNYQDDIIIYPKDPSNAGVAPIITYLQGIPVSAQNTATLWANTVQVTGAGFTAFFFVPNVECNKLQALKAALRGSVRQIPPFSDVQVAVPKHCLILMLLFRLCSSISLHSLT